jgi:hypothetical protein
MPGNPQGLLDELREALGHHAGPRVVTTRAAAAWAVAEIERLQARIVTIDIDGRPVLMDSVAECEAALAAVEEQNERYRAALAGLARNAVHPYSEVARKALNA